METKVWQNSAIRANKVSVNEKLAAITSDFGKYIVDWAEREMPDVFQSFYPRKYENLGNYHGPKLVAAVLTSAVSDIRREGVASSPTAVKLLAPCLGYFVEKRVPMLFIAPKLLDAVKRTDFNSDLDWTKMKLPYEHGIFMMPRDSGLSHPTDGEVGLIVWSRLAPKIYRARSLRIEDVEMANQSFSIMAFCPKVGVWYESTLANERTSFRLRNLFYENEDIPSYDSPQGHIDSPLNHTTDRSFLEDLGVVVFGTILALNARPALLEPAKRLKVVKAREGLREWWSPNIVGRHYAIRKEPQGGTHASPRLHWRRGHFRQQPHGVGRAERKTIWLEPMLVSA